MKFAKALDRWLNSIDEDAGDSPLELAETAFQAGWQAARPPIKGTLSGHVLHNGDTWPGHLKFTFHGETKDGQDIQLTMTEGAARVMLASFARVGIGMDAPQSSRPGAPLTTCTPGRDTNQHQEG